jgi:hypothetical protein
MSQHIHINGLEVFAPQVYKLIYCWLEEPGMRFMHSSFDSDSPFSRAVRMHSDVRPISAPFLIRRRFPVRLGFERMLTPGSHAAGNRLAHLMRRPAAVADEDSDGGGHAREADEVHEQARACVTSEDEGLMPPLRRRRQQPALLTQEHLRRS